MRRILVESARRKRRLKHGSGLFDNGLSIWPSTSGTPATLTVTGSTITANQADGGAGGVGGSTYVKNAGPGRSVQLRGALLPAFKSGLVTSRHRHPIAVRGRPR